MNIGGYRLIKRIGAGGMSTVFEAEDGAGVRVALKLLHPALVVDYSGRERLRREVAMLQKVRGRYVAEVLDAETDADEAFIVTELIDGPTLEQDVVDSGVFEGEDLVELAEHLRQAVEAIHEAGVLHRDLKPSNVMLGPDGPVLIDFGIAQVDEDSRLTVPGSVAHTPGYCDPRVINGANPDETADWWALAAVLAFAATGRAPFGKGNPQAIMRRVFEGVPDIVGIQGPVAAAFVRALAPDIEDRIGIDELVAVLKTGRFDDASSGPNSAFAGIAGVMGGVGGLAGAAGSAMREGDTFEPLVTGETASRGVGAAEELRAPGAFGDGYGQYGDADYDAHRGDDAYGRDKGLGWDEGPETALRMRRAQLGGPATEILGAPGPGGGGPRSFRRATLISAVGGPRSFPPGSSAATTLGPASGPRRRPRSSRLNPQWRPRLPRCRRRSPWRRFPKRPGVGGISAKSLGRRRLGFSPGNRSRILRAPSIRRRGMSSSAGRRPARREKPPNGCAPCQPSAFSCSSEASRFSPSPCDSR